VTTKYPISEFDRELVYATMRAWGCMGEPDLDAIVADAIERTNTGPDWPFTLVAYGAGGEYESPRFDVTSHVGLSEAIAEIGREIHHGTDACELLLFHGQPLDISEFHAEQSAAIAAEKTRAAAAWKERQERERTLHLAEVERRERATLAELKRKYGTSAD
jgi:hypothetical protein